MQLVWLIELDQWPAAAAAAVACYLCTGNLSDISTKDCSALLRPFAFDKPLNLNLSHIYAAYADCILH